MRSPQYSWLAPKDAGQTLFYNKPGDWKTFRTLAEVQAATGQEKHGSKSISTFSKR